MNVGPVTVQEPQAHQSDDREGVYLGEGVWNEEVTQLTRVVSDYRPIPVHLVRTYSEQAARQGVVTQLEDGSWHAEIPGFQGVWANGEFASDALVELADVVFDWAILKMLDRDVDLPVVGDIDLRVT